MKTPKSYWTDFNWIERIFICVLNWGKWRKIRRDTKRIARDWKDAEVKLRLISVCGIPNETSVATKENKLICGNPPRFGPCTNEFYVDDYHPNLFDVMDEIGAINDVWMDMAYNTKGLLKFILSFRSERRGSSGGSGRALPTMDELRGGITEYLRDPGPQAVDRVDSLVASAFDHHWTLSGSILRKAKPGEIVDNSWQQVDLGSIPTQLDHSWFLAKRYAIKNAFASAAGPYFVKGVGFPAVLIEWADKQQGPTTQLFIRALKRS